MASTYVNNLRLNEMATGDASGTWGTTTNTNLELVGQALGYGTEAITTNADTHASTVADGAADEARAMYIKYTGTLDSACTITIGPNTLKRVHIIENATSGSQNIIIKQGSGATVTIGNGNVSVVYLDGAGSGAAVVNAFTDLETAGTITVAGNLIASADATVGDDLSLVSDAAVLGFGADTDVTLTHVADTGLLLNSSRQLQFGDSGTYIHQSADGTLDLVADTEIEINATTIDMNGALNLSGNALVSGEVQTANIGYTDGDNAIVIADGGGITAANGITSTAASNTFGATSFNDADITNVGSIALDTITNDGTDITLDSSGDIILDADGADIIFKDGGTSFGKVQNSSTNMIIESLVSDKDIQFYGNDGGASVLALTLDMSDAGTAIFNHDIVMGDNANIFMGNGYDLRLQSDGTNGIIYAANGNLTLDVAGDINLDADGADINLKDGGTVFGVFSSTNNDLNIRTTATDEDIVFKGSDGGSEITALTLDMSDSGTANFGGAVVLGGSLIKTGDMTLDASGDIILDADGADIILKDGGTQFGKISKGGGSDLIINASIADKDIFLTGTDGSTAITALTLDMSAAGAATFNSSVIGTIINAGVSSSVGIGAATADANVAELGRGYLNLGRDDTADAAQIAFSKNGILHSSVVTTNNDLIIKGNISNLGTRFDGSDNGSNITALRLDMSNAGTATFNSNVNVGGIGNVNLSGSTSEVSVGVSGDTDNSGGGVSFAHNTSTLNSYVLGQKVSMTIGTAISTPLLFVTNNSERWRFNSSGHFTPAQQHTYDIGGVNSEVRNIYAQGLYVGGSAAANKLDDYEEGSFTPSLGIPSGSISYSAQEGSYTKVGSVVNIVMAFGLSGISSPSGNLSISGLPFSAGHAEKFVAGMVVGLARNFTTEFDNLRGYLNNGSNSITLAVNNTTTGHATPNANTLQSNTQLYVSMTYNTDE